MIDLALTEFLDISINEDGDLTTTDNIDTMIVASIFQNQRTSDEVKQFDLNGDGSTFWASKNEEDILSSVKTALAFLVADGLASNVEVSIFTASDGVSNLKIDISTTEERIIKEYKL